MIVTGDPVYFAELRTEHFTFHAIADSAELARRRIAIGFSEHLVQYTPGIKGTTPQKLVQVRATWGAETSGSATADFEQFVEALDEWYGICVSVFKKDTDVLRDGDRI